VMVEISSNSLRTVSAAHKKQTRIFHGGGGTIIVRIGKRGLAKQINKESDHLEIVKI